MKKIAKNEFEKFVRVTGMTKRRFSEVTGLQGTSVTKYLENPTMLRLKHLQLLADADEFKNQDVGDVELLNMINYVK
jgi:hypothetical protein|tara:strand:- start:1592 stop:1822 length:231 start_codon:yes stop_codon:yes gene_type:complete